MIPNKGPKGVNDLGRTPIKFYKNLDSIFHFDFDPCPPNPTFDGLSIEWGKRNYVNCPWSDKEPWILKAIEEQKKGKLTVMWLPVGTDTHWFTKLILPNAVIHWIHGRITLDNGKHPSYPSMLCIFFPKLY
jgi:hypothetical protein